MNHKITYHLEKEISDKGFPRSEKRYEAAHKQADIQEKKDFPKGYEEMKHVDARLGRHELSGKNLKGGKIEVSEKVPKKLRQEVAEHEFIENRILRGKGNKKGKAKNVR